ncbi:MAG: hypothetical protein HY821_12675 [Acidobacteria bacterium]|nr:hypothetical protein [Acidobacteriota bacterium]
MRNHLVGVWVCLGSACVWGQAAGTWDTPQGRMTLQQNGKTVEGRYTTDNGKILGVMNGSVLEGVWIEDGSAQRCSRPAADGRYYWGHVRFWIQGSTFRGAWNYCDAPVAHDGEWNGTRVSEGAQAGAVAAKAGAGMAPAAGGGGYWMLEKTQMIPPTAEQLGSHCVLVSADARERGMRLEYSCHDLPTGRTLRYAGNLDYEFSIPSPMKPGMKMTGQGRLAAQSGNWGGGCSVGALTIIPSMSAETGANQGARSSGEVIVAAPHCSAAGCPSLVISCTIGSTQQLEKQWIYRWVK